MKSRFVLSTALFIGALAVSVVLAQPPERGGQPPREKGAPPRFELGKVLPPHIREQLELTKDQEKALAELEKTVKEKLEKMLTTEQKKKLEKAGPPMGGPPSDGPGGPPMKGGGGGQEKKPGGEKKPTDDVAKSTAGIQWFTTWESAKLEAEKTGRPILFVSAAPHCAGISGIW